jgi:GxxExxY protein
VHPFFEKANGLTHTIIAAAIEVHRILGPGLIESVYEWALVKELELRGLKVESQESVTVHYKAHVKEAPLKFDVLVEGCCLVEVKAVEAVHPIYKAKAISYLRLLDLPICLIINFHEVRRSMECIA